MFRVRAFPTNTPNVFNLYVADIFVSCVTSQHSVEEVQEHYQLSEVWLRYYTDDDEPESVDLSIIYTISNLNKLKF